MKFKGSFAVLICLSISVCLFSGCSKGEASVFTADGKNLAAYGEMPDDKALSSFLDVAETQSSDILKGLLNCSKETAKKQLKSGGYRIETTFDAEISEQVESALLENGGCKTAAAVTDNAGKILACYSSESETNLALTPTRPCSSFKPLSVYAPAIENNKAVWSSVKPDTAVKQVLDSSGNLYDWPPNANNRYTNENINLSRAIKESCNTVAVKWLLELGVGNSMDFLTRKLGIKLDREQQVSALKGDNEILANLGLGYLYDGVSPIDMAGYYQIFADGGLYAKPYAVTAISDKNGKVIYSADISSNRVIKEETAFIMNKLLQTPVTKGGTAESAAIDGIKVGGKTGTSSDGADNWFVGFTPDLTCAVWHGPSDGEKTANKAPKLFFNIVSGIKSERKEFPACNNVLQKVYCKESGMLLSNKCTQMETGYFSSENTPGKCNIH